MDLMSETCFVKRTTAVFNIKADLNFKYINTIQNYCEALSFGNQ